jgi:uncharacterized protein (DUF1778 family)/GNAT superfamily N-acetyltransferase
MQLRPLSWLHKSAQHQISASAEQEVLLRRAAELKGLSLPDFILDSACSAAELAVMDQKHFLVSGYERQQLMKLQERAAQTIAPLEKWLAHSPPWEGNAVLTPPVALAEQHSIFQFDCGRRALNDWLTQHARQSQLKGSAKTFVCCAQQRVIAYFSLSVGQVDSCELPGHGQAYLDRNAFPVPVVTLTRLAVDLLYQKQGLGQALLQQAIHHTLLIAQQAAVEALLTQPIDEPAAQFYQAHGFTTSPAAYKQLILMIKDIEMAYLHTGKTSLQQT